MDTVHSMSSPDWHIPRPSLSGSSATGSVLSDGRSRGGSASSQGSSSNHSTHSVSSGSFLLSAAHLARVQGDRPKEVEEDRPSYKSSLGTYVAQRDIVVPIPEESADPFWHGVKQNTNKSQDACSVASSTHFTLVNGFSRIRNDKVKTCCCDHSHQITVLVIFMTILFSACILAAICFVEMKMRKETGIYRYS